MPVFSLRSENSFGVGEFADLKPLADWGKQAGLKLIQLLPINDTSATHTWKDSYPYAAISAFALHPIYLNLAAVADAKNKQLLLALEPERQRLNALDAVDYEAVMKAKLGFLRQIFPSQKTATFRSAGIQNFLRKTNTGLCLTRRFVSCATSSARRISASGRNTRTFRRRKNRRAGAGQRRNRVPLFRPVSSASAVAGRGGARARRRPRFEGRHRHRRLSSRRGRVAVSRSCFTWTCRPARRRMPFAAKGQNWGFPTYNWPRMAADGFAWWKQRFRADGQLFRRVPH